MTRDDIARLLDFMGVPAGQNSINAFLRRCDRDADLKLDFEEWLTTIGRSSSEIEVEIKRIEDEEKARIQKIKDEEEAWRKKNQG